MNGTFALVVDDSKSARFAMRRFLENSEQEVDTAESGLDALEKIRQRKPDILFLDHVMPVLDGFGVLEMLKRDEAMASIPVVLCTSNDSAEFARLARARGVREILIKPPSAQQLTALLQRIGQANPAAITYAEMRVPEMHPAAEPIPSAPSYTPAYTSDYTSDYTFQAAPYAAPLQDPFPTFAPEPSVPPLVEPPFTAEPIPAPIPLFAGIAAEDPGPIPNRVQTIRDPEDAIERAVMKTLREALPEGIFAAAMAPSAPRVSASLASTLAQPAAVAENNLAPRIEALRDQFQNRVQQVTRELVAQIGSLRTQLAQLETAGSVARGGDEERLGMMQQSQFLLESRIDRMAGHFDSVLDTLRQDMETQTQRIERVGREARAAATDEAHAVSERIVMNAAKRISDQVAESVLSLLKPAPTQHFR